MVVKLTKRKLASFVADQVKSGRYGSADAAVEDAIERLMIESPPAKLSARDRAAIRQSDEEVTRGETIDFDTAARQLRRKFGIG